METIRVMPEMPKPRQIVGVPADGQIRKMQVTQVTRYRDKESGYWRDTKAVIIGLLMEANEWGELVLTRDERQFQWDTENEWSCDAH